MVRGERGRSSGLHPLRPSLWDDRHSSWRFEGRRRRQGPVYSKKLQALKILGLTHNSVVVAFPEFSLGLGTRMGDRPLPALLQLPLTPDLRAGIELVIDKRLLAKLDDEAGAAAKAA